MSAPTLDRVQAQPWTLRAQWAIRLPNGHTWRGLAAEFGAPHSGESMVFASRAAAEAELTGVVIEQAIALFGVSDYRPNLLVRKVASGNGHDIVGAWAPVAREVV